MNKDLLKEFIEIGLTENFDNLKTLFVESEVEKQGEIMRQAFQYWYDIAASLKDNEIVALIKTFTIAEKTLPGWCAGSVSPVIWLGIKLSERKYTEIDKLRDWVKSHSDNDWLTKRW